MEVKIFVDVLFIINFIIDYILLSVTSLFARKKLKILNTVLAATVGGIFSAVMFFVPMAQFLSAAFVFSVSLLMILIAFGKRSFLKILKDTAILYLVSLVSGGLAFAVLPKYNSLFNNGIFYADINAYSLLFVFVMAVIIIHGATGYIRRQKIKSSYIYEITVERNGKTITDFAFFDSGNFLTDPLSQKSVIVAEWKSVAPLFEETKITDAIVKNPQDFVYIGCKNFSTTTGLYAFYPDKISSDDACFCEDFLIAVTETPLDKEGSYRMLLPNTTLSGKGYNNEHHF